MNRSKDVTERRTLRSLASGAVVAALAAGLLIWAATAPTTTEAARGGSQGDAALAAAEMGHDSGDYFIFAKAAHGPASETNCNGSNDKQADVSGSGNQIRGRIHSNADIAISGQGNSFFDTASGNPEITFGSHDEDCKVQAEAGNSYLSAPLPTSTWEIDGLAAGVDPAGGWPGNLGGFLTQTGSNAYKTFPNTTTTSAVGVTCTEGSLTSSSDITLDADDDGKVICNGTGKIQLNISSVGTAADPFNITMISHGPIEISGQNVVLAPQTFGTLAWTDVNSSVTDVGIKLSGSNLDIHARSLLFTPRTGQDIAGSDDSTMCISVIGQGRLKFAGSNSQFGPLLPCSQASSVPSATPSPEPTPEVTPTPTPTPTATPEPTPEVTPTPTPTPTPTLEPTPGPTDEPTPEATPEATPEPTPEATPEATPEPTPEATPDPTPEATPEPTPEATPEPTPEATPEPTPGATPESTPEPTPEPTPEATPEPTPEATPERSPDPTPEATPEPTPEATPELTTDPTPAPTPGPTPGGSPEPTPEATPQPTPGQTPAVTPTPTAVPTPTTTSVTEIVRPTPGVLSVPLAFPSTGGEPQSSDQGVLWLGISFGVAAVISAAAAVVLGRRTIGIRD